jgi:hypothetical protein
MLMTPSMAPQERRGTLNKYLQTILAAPELRTLDIVGLFLSDAWRNRGTQPKACLGHAPSRGSAGRQARIVSDAHLFPTPPGQNGIGALISPSRPRTRSLLVPKSGNVLSPPMGRRASLEESPPIAIRPSRSQSQLRRMPMRKMPLPLNLKSVRAP